MRIIEKAKQKVLSIFSALSGGLSFLGGWQICHNVCLGIIALLSLIGITIVGMPLLFLNQYAIYFWLFAMIILIPVLIMHKIKGACMSKKIIMLNIGIIVASVPFFDEFAAVFWVIGGAIILYVIFLFVNERRKNGK